MMRVLAVALTSFAVACVALAACGGGGDDRLSEEEYFERVEELVNEADPEISLSSEGIDVWDPEEGRPQLAERYTSAAERTRMLADDLDDLDPPVHLESLHTEFANAVDDLSSSIATLAELTAELPQGPGGETFEAVSIAFDRVRELSSAIQAAATERGIAVELAWQGENISSQTIDIAEGVRGRLGEMPPLPDRLVAMSEYIEFETDDGNIAATIGLPLVRPADDAAALAWYSYASGEWTRLEATLVLEQEGSVASGDFESVPASLAVFREE